MEKEPKKQKYVYEVAKELKDYIFLTGGNNRFIDLNTLMKDLEEAEKNHQSKEEEMKKSIFEIIRALDFVIDKPKEDNTTMLTRIRYELENVAIKLTSDK